MKYRSLRLVLGIVFMLFSGIDCGSGGGGSRTDHDVLVARSMDDGVTWTAPAALNTDASTDQGDDFDPQMTTDGQGVWIAVWDSSAFEDPFRTDFDILLARSTNNGATWTGHAELNTNAGSDTGQDSWPQLSTDGQGVWIAVWDSLDSLDGTIGTDFDILMARSVDNAATWSAPTALNSNAGSDGGKRQSAAADDRWAGGLDRDLALIELARRHDRHR